VVFPKEISTVSDYELVADIFLYSTTEGRLLSVHNEKDNGCGEQIDRGATVGTSFMDLWCHILRGTQLGLQVTFTITALDGGCKTEVRDL